MAPTSFWSHQIQTPKASRPAVAVVVSTFRRPDAVHGLLRSLASGSRVPDEVIVVDNDPAGPALVRPPHGLAVRVIPVGLGLNVAAARNRGWRATQAELCIFIDDDNVVATSTVQVLAETWMRDPGIGLVAPIIYQPEPMTGIWCAGTRRSMWTTRTRFLYRGDGVIPARETWDTDDMPDAFLVPRAVLEAIGGFDEEAFPFHYAETDLAERIRAAGHRTIVVRGAHLWHTGGGQVSSPGEEMVRAWRDGGRSRVRLTSTARVRFHARHSRGLRRLVALGAGVPMYLAVIATSCLRRTELGIPERASLVLTLLGGAADGYRLSWTASRRRP